MVCWRVKHLSNLCGIFEWQLICYLGFEFSFTCEGFSGTPLMADALYQFNPRVGFERVARNNLPGAFTGRAC